MVKKKEREESLRNVKLSHLYSLTHYSPKMHFPNLFWQKKVYFKANSLKLISRYAVFCIVAYGSAWTEPLLKLYYICR